LPADFDKWDAAPQPQVSSPGLIDRLKSEAQAVYHHPGQALLGAAKQVPALVQSMLPSAGVMGEVPGADTSGKMQMPSIANAYNKASAAVTKATTPQTEAQQGGAHLATAASLAAPAVGLVKAGVEAIRGCGKGSEQDSSAVGKLARCSYQVDGLAEENTTGADTQQVPESHHQPETRSAH